MTNQRPSAGVGGDRGGPRGIDLFLVLGSALVLAVTLLGFAALRREQTAAVHIQLRSDLAAATTSLQRLSAGATTAPAAIAGLFMSVGPDAVTQERFRRFATPLLDTESISALEWIPRVRTGELAAFLEQRRAGRLGFAIREFGDAGTELASPDRPEYYPVSFIEPLAGNERALGVDLASEPTRRAALEAARDTGLPTATGPIQLAQGGIGILVFHPAYDGERDPGDIAARRARLIGFGLALVRPSVLLERAGSDPALDEVVLALEDLGPTSEPATPEGMPVASAPSPVPTVEPGLGAPFMATEPQGPRERAAFDLAGRHYALTATARSGYLARVGLIPAWALGTAVLVGSMLLLVVGVQRRRHGLALEAAARRLRAVVDASPDAFIGLGLDGRIVDWGRRAVRDFGLTPEQALGRPLTALLELDELEAQEARSELEAAARAGSTAPVFLEGRMTHADGRILPVELTLAIAPPGSGWPVTCFVRDATEEVRARDERVRLARFEALGRLASGVAHDFNNLLYGIETIAGSIAKHPDTPDVAVAASEIVEASERGGEMTRALLTFARGGSTERRRVEPSVELAVTVGLIERLLGGHVRVVTAIPQGLPALVLDGTGLTQALMNLAVNARDAMPDGGTIAISAGDLEVDDEEAAAAEIPPRRYVRISVADTGTGIDPALLPRIFEPFFTTKPANIGSGLGLAIIYGFVKASDGGVRVESEVGRGSTFHLYLPVP